MPALKDITDFFDRTAPKELGAPWDNEGVMVTRTMERAVNRLLLALDATPAVTSRAVQEGYDCVITHHPLCFTPFRTIDPSSSISRQMIELICGDVSLLSYHTRLDSAESFGVNATLAGLLGMENAESFGIPENPSLGRIGGVGGISLGELARRVKDRLGCPAVSFTGSADTPVRRLAVVGGGGKDFIGAAAALGADTFLIGEVNYNPLLDYAANGLNIVCGGHYHTEVVVLEPLQRALREAFPDLEIDIYTGENEITYI